jgi:predicted GNAT family acetyltransferase
MGFVFTKDPAEFRHHAWPFVEDRLEYNVLATILIAVLDGRYADVQPQFAYRFDAAGAVDAAALRTPPYSLIATELDPAAADELVGGWLDEDPGVSGANGLPATARAVADAWRAGTGGSTRVTRSMAMHALATVVDPPRPPAGRLRLADRSERELLVDWWRAFAIEAESVGGARAAANVDARLDAAGVFVWDDGGPVSLVAVSPAVAGVVRLGPVYTPPNRRRRGYAGMAVAEVSRDALLRGAGRCTLFTDLDNPTSNKIYAEVGYRRFGDWEEHAFERADGR